MNLTDLTKQARKLYDKIYYGDVLPPVGAAKISYAKLLQLLSEKKVKRLYLMADGRYALVEVPVPGTASNYEGALYDKLDPTATPFADQRPEWQIEKWRYYVELPGDVWSQGQLMSLVKASFPHRGKDGRVPYEFMLRQDSVSCELVVFDPSQANMFLADNAGSFASIIGLIALRGLVGTVDRVLEKFGRKKKSKMEEQAEKLTASRAKEFNVDAKDPKTKKVSRLDTGVRFSDVAGIDSVKSDILDVLSMMKGENKWNEMGAKMPRGILLEGPPGTGKTYLAKAMAGEAGIPFYSANGAEFVEMFQGVAAARIRSLFESARQHASTGAIVFIDEIDAIGLARGDGGGDPGTQEREQGLMQLLVEMDGFKKNDRVLVMAATNRVSVLDDALLRPGRFDRIMYMGRPSKSNRLKILQVHSRNKKFAEEAKKDELLAAAADLTIGYSGAELANLLNEAAILSVRHKSKGIDLRIVLEAMDKIKLGLPQKPLENSPAKRRLAIQVAARAVAFALTPGFPPLELATIKPRGGQLGRLLFVQAEFGIHGDQWHTYDFMPTNAAPYTQPLSTYELLKSLLMPLYAARACEEVMYGPKGVTLSTTKELAKAADLAYYLVAVSGLHPDFRDSNLMMRMWMGGNKDPTTKDLAHLFEPRMLALQREAYARTKAVMAERRAVIERIADLLLENPDESVKGSVILDLVRTSNAAAAAAAASAVPTPAAQTPEASEDGAAAAAFQRTDAAVAKAVQVLQGQLPVEVVLQEAGMFDRARRTAMRSKWMLDDPEDVPRLQAAHAFATQEAAPFPPPPRRSPVFRGVTLAEWLSAAEPRGVEVIQVLGRPGDARGGGAGQAPIDVAATSATGEAQMRV